MWHCTPVSSGGKILLETHFAAHLSLLAKSLLQKKHFFVWQPEPGNFF